MELINKFWYMMKDNYYTKRIAYEISIDIPRMIKGNKWDVEQTKKKYKRVFGKEIDLNDPQTINEKIIWLKLNEHKDFHTVCADKYAAREYWRKYGDDGLVPLLYHTEDWRDITLDKIPDEPCIIKCNTGCGTHKIIRDKSSVDIKQLRRDCRIWMMGNFYYRTQEWQYKNVKPCIIIEKLLLDKKGKIPNDYKLNFINGKLAFTYCSIDREGKNYRSIYSPEWERLDMEWVGANLHKGGMVGDNIPQPMTYPRMKEIGEDIAKNFKYVRVDFYDVDGKLYYGEITLHHGAGYNTFEPAYWDEKLGQQLDISDLVGGGRQENKVKIQYSYAVRYGRSAA